ncbi:MAG: homoserine O-acetyltransferase [Bacteroidia bacterium]
MSYNTYTYNNEFILESGVSLPSIEIAYHTYGKLNKAKNNVIWVCHALTANSDVFDWWNGLFGDKDYFNPEEYFIVCANNLGSCYGTTGPLSFNTNNNAPLYSYFPTITVRDMVKAHDVLREHLGIKKIHTLIGGSQGGQQALEWNVEIPSLFENLILIATNAKHSAWGIAFNESQRLAIKADRTYFSNTNNGGSKGLLAARSMALLSYRNYNAYANTQSETSNDKTEDFAAASYQRYQGEKLVLRFNAYSYVALTKSMDSHNLGRDRISVEASLLRITANTLVIGLTTDVLFPVNEQRFIAKYIGNSIYEEINSTYGHDGFLIETKKITEKIKSFFKIVESRKSQPVKSNQVFTILNN